MEWSWPVSRDKDGETGFFMLDSKDIIKFSSEGSNYLVHTRDEVFYILNTLDKIESAFAAVGLPYARADRGELIDLSTVEKIEDKYEKAVFEGGKSATISRTKFKAIKEKFLSLIERKNE